MPKKPKSSLWRTGMGHQIDLGIFTHGIIAADFPREQGGNGSGFRLSLHPLISIGAQVLLKNWRETQLYPVRLHI